MTIIVELHLSLWPLLPKHFPPSHRHGFKPHIISELTHRSKCRKSIFSVMRCCKSVIIIPAILVSVSIWDKYPSWCVWLICKARMNMTSAYSTSLTWLDANAAEMNGLLVTQSCWTPYFIFLSHTFPLFILTFLGMDCDVLWRGPTLVIRGLLAITLSNDDD